MHGWWDGWWMGGMMLWMVLFWGAIIFGVIWLIRANGERRPPRRDDAMEILDRRLAEGAITFDEYREKKAILSGE